MKKLSKEEQIEKNGGYTVWHCHQCKSSFKAWFGTTSSAAKKHIKKKGHTGYKIWGDGYLWECSNY